MGVEKVRGCTKGEHKSEVEIGTEINEAIGGRHSGLPAVFGAAVRLPN